MKRIYIFLMLIALISGCSSLPKSTRPVEQEQSVSNQSVYIVSHGWHTGIVFPREKLLEHIPGLSSRFPYGNYLEIGWGDKAFYQANEITTGITLRAIFWPTDSVVHVVAVPLSPYDSFPNSETRVICLNKSQTESLGMFLSNSFGRNQANQIVPKKEGIYGDSQFYVGMGSYYLFNTCNKWTAKGLESAGFDISTTLKLTASSIINYIDANENSNKSLPDKMDATRPFCR